MKAILAYIALAQLSIIASVTQAEIVPIKRECLSNMSSVAGKRNKNERATFDWTNSVVEQFHT